MKNIKKILLMIVLATLTFVSCQKDEIDNYNGKNQIYFKYAVDGNDLYGRNLVDSLSYSFAFEIPSITETVYNVPVKLQGYLSEEDRAFEVKLSDDNEAQEGIHFTLPSSFLIPANENVGYVPITLKRTEDLKDKEVSIKIKLVSNENFDANLFGETDSSNANLPLSYNEFELTVTDNLLTKPKNWSSYVDNLLGEYSAKKLYLYAEVNQIPVPDWNTDSIVLIDFKARVDVLKAYLDAQKAAGTPVLEDDGTEMELGLYA